jgi:hypothetical protein
MEKNQAFKTVRAAFPFKNEEKEEGTEEVKKETKEPQEVHLKLRLLLSAKQMIIENYPLPLGRTVSRLVTIFGFINNSFVIFDSLLHRAAPKCNLCTSDAFVNLVEVLGNSLGGFSLFRHLLTGFFFGYKFKAC